MGVKKYNFIERFLTKSVFWSRFYYFFMGYTMLRWFIFLFYPISFSQKRSILKYFWYKIISPDSTVMAIFICPSYVCQLNCKHCYEEKLDSSIFLTTEEIKKIIDDFHNFLHGFHITFCSGEVLLRNDLMELISYAFNKGIFSSIVTNGLLLSDEKIKELKRAGASQIVVSIDHPDRDKHDELRGYKGCYDKALVGLKKSIENGFNTLIWTYVSAFNENDLEKLRLMGEELGVSGIFVYFSVLSGKMTYKDNLTFHEREKIRNKIKYPIRLEFPTEKTKCFGGAKHIAVLPTGEITPCPSVSCSYGNIRKDNLKEVFVRLKKDCVKFNNEFTGQCMINNPKYREAHVIRKS